MMMTLIFNKFAGSPLDGPCNVSSDCLAVNSQCKHNICQCDEPFAIAIEMSANASACLTGMLRTSIKS